MALSGLKDVRRVVSSLNADEIRGLAAQQVTVGLISSSGSTWRRMEDFLAPPCLGSLARARILAGVRPVDGSAKNFDFVLCEPGHPLPANGYLFEPGSEDSLLPLIVSEHPKLELSLANTLPLFRPAVSHKV